MSNFVLLSGNLTRDPEVTTIRDRKLAKFSIGVSNKDKDKTSSFFDIEVWGQPAEYIEKYIKKGNRVNVSGKLRQDVWENEGQKRSKIKVIAIEVEGLKTGSPVEREEEKGNTDISPSSSETFAADSSEAPF